MTNIAIRTRATTPYRKHSHGSKSKDSHIGAHIHRCGLVTFLRWLSTEGLSLKSILTSTPGSQRKLRKYPFVYLKLERTHLLSRSQHGYIAFSGKRFTLCRAAEDDIREEPLYVAEKPRIEREDGQMFSACSATNKATPAGGGDG